MFLLGCCFIGVFWVWFGGSGVGGFGGIFGFCQFFGLARTVSPWKLAFVRD